MAAAAKWCVHIFFTLIIMVMVSQFRKKMIKSLQNFEIALGSLGKSGVFVYGYFFNRSYHMFLNNAMEINGLNK